MSFFNRFPYRTLAVRNLERILLDIIETGYADIPLAWLKFGKKDGFWQFTGHRGQLRYLDVAA